MKAPAKRAKKSDSTSSSTTEVTAVTTSRKPKKETNDGKSSISGAFEGHSALNQLSNKPSRSNSLTAARHHSRDVIVMNSAVPSKINIAPEGDETVNVVGSIGDVNAATNSIVGSHQPLVNGIASPNILNSSSARNIAAVTGSGGQLIATSSQRPSPHGPLPTTPLTPNNITGVDVNAQQHGPPPQAPSCFMYPKPPTAARLVKPITTFKE